MTDSLGSLVGLDTESFSDWEVESPLGLNYPNPFSQTTRIPFTVPYSAPVDLRIFDLQGKQVASLVHEDMGTGYYSYEWTPEHLPSGIYVYRLQIGHKSYSRKLQLGGF